MTEWSNLNPPQQLPAHQPSGQPCNILYIQKRTVTIVLWTIILAACSSWWQSSPPLPRRMHHVAIARDPATRITVFNNRILQCASYCTFRSHLHSRHVPLRCARAPGIWACSIIVNRSAVHSRFSALFVCLHPSCVWRGSWPSLSLSDITEGASHSRYARVHQVITASVKGFADCFSSPHGRHSRKTIPPGESSLAGTNFS